MNNNPVVTPNKSTKNISFAYLTEQFFLNTKTFKYPHEILDITKTSEERAARTYTLVLIEVKGLTILIPLRSGNKDLIGNVNLNGCFFRVPTEKRNNAILDYRKAIIVSPGDYILDNARIAYNQKKQISDNLGNIQLEFFSYFEEFLNAFDQEQKLIINNPKNRDRYLKSALKNYLPLKEIEEYTNISKDINYEDDKLVLKN